jgi:AraC-like DNA-binding protein
MNPPSRRLPQMVRGRAVDVIVAALGLMTRPAAAATGHLERVATGQMALLGVVATCAGVAALTSWLRAGARRRVLSLVDRITPTAAAGPSHEKSERPPSAPERSPEEEDVTPPGPPIATGSFLHRLALVASGETLPRHIEAIRQLVSSAAPRPRTRSGRAIARVCQSLEAGMTVDELAAALFVSRRTLHRAVVTEQGCTPSELIMAVRLREAKRLLLAEGRMVKNVAGAVGFPSVPHFSRTFKRFFGVAPSEAATTPARPGSASGRPT